jgi:hypothetical protein
LPPSWPFCRPAGPLPPSWPFAAKLALCRQDGPLPPGRFQLLITILTASVLNCQQQQRLSTCPLRRWQQCWQAGLTLAATLGIVSQRARWPLLRRQSPLSCPKLKRTTFWQLI